MNHAQSDQINELIKAMVAVQAVLEGAKKDSENPFFKSKYADLESCWEAARAPLSKNGLCVIQTTQSDPAMGICIVTTLAHVSGQWIRGVLPVTAAKLDPQGIGAAITYARRYGLAAILGLVQVDDDGETAMGRGQPGQQSDKPKVAVSTILVPVNSAGPLCCGNPTVTGYNPNKWYCRTCKVSRDKSGVA